MTRSSLRLAAILVGLAAVSLAACAPAPASTAGTVRWDRDGIRLAIPDGWEIRASTDLAAGGSRRLLYLATQLMGDDCAPGAYRQACRLPVERLEAGGVLVWWHTTICAGPACSLPDGRLSQVGGRDAVGVPPGDGCGQIGQTDASAYLVAVSPQRLDTIVICSRDAPEATLGELRDLLDGVTWRTP